MLNNSQHLLDAAMGVGIPIPYLRTRASGAATCGGGSRLVAVRDTRLSSFFRRLLSMSAASVRTSGRRDSFPVFPIAAGKRGESGFLWLFTR